MVIEVWKVIKDYPNYLISSLGNVYSLNKKRILKLQTDKNGYKVTALINEKGRKLLKVHRLVAQNFISNKKNKQQVNHKNGDKSDNRVQNLEWTTPSENVKHSYDKLGRKPNINSQKGEKNGNSKLTWEQVKKIREGKECAKYYADKFNISKSMINTIRRGEAWKW